MIGLCFFMFFAGSCFPGVLSFGDEVQRKSCLSFCERRDLRMLNPESCGLTEFCFYDYKEYDMLVLTDAYHKMTCRINKGSVLDGSQVFQVEVSRLLQTGEPVMLGKWAVTSKDVRRDYTAGFVVENTGTLKDFFECCSTNPWVACQYSIRPYACIVTRFFNEGCAPCFVGLKFNYCSLSHALVLAGKGGVLSAYPVDLMVFDKDL